MGIAAFLGALGFFVNVYDVYVYTSFVTKIWTIALMVVYCSIMILCPLLFFMILGAIGWSIGLLVDRLLAKR